MYVIHVHVYVCPCTVVCERVLQVWMLICIVLRMYIHTICMHVYLCVTVCKKLHVGVDMHVYIQHVPM